MPTRIFIDGAEGTTGLEIRDRLAGRTDLAVTTLPDALRKDASARADALAAADLVILCLPDDAAREAVALLANGSARVIDASTAHRIDPAWAYGFAELADDQAASIAAARHVANPGCYPTGFLALVRPLIDAGLIPPGWPLSVNAVSGYSGGGKAMIAAFAGGNVATAHRAYALGLDHKHLPEMRVHAGLDHAPVFAPAVTNTYRGMLVEVPLALAALPGAPTPARIHEALADAYATRGGLVRVMPLGPQAALDVERCADSDAMELYVLASPTTGHTRLIAALDNLGKGAAGAAVQNLNLMTGAEPLTGLRT